MSRKSEHNHDLPRALSDAHCMTWLIVLLVIISGISLAILLTF
jgi:hypothetical protein